MQVDQNDVDMNDAEPVDRCLYCECELSEDAVGSCQSDEVPQPSDDTAWEAITRNDGHSTACEWLTTRGHQR